MGNESDGGTPPTWRRRMAWLAIGMTLGGAISFFGVAAVRGRGFDTAIVMTFVMAVVAGLLWLAVRKLDD